MHHEIRSLKHTIEQKNLTIVQLKKNFNILKSQTTSGSIAGSLQVDSDDPRLWSVQQHTEVLLRLDAVRLTNPVCTESMPNYGDFTEIHVGLPVWTPEGFAWNSVGNTAL